MGRAHLPDGLRGRRRAGDAGLDGEGAAGLLRRTGRLEGPGPSGSAPATPGPRRGETAELGGLGKGLLGSVGGCKKLANAHGVEGKLVVREDQHLEPAPLEPVAALVISVGLVEIEMP